MKKINKIICAVIIGALALFATGCGGGGKGEYTDLLSLKGKVVVNIGENNVPDLIFKTVLRLERIEYVVSPTPVEGKVALHYVADSAGVSGLVLADKAYMGIMAEPSVSGVLGGTDKLDVKLDVQKAYYDAMKKNDGSYGYPQAVLVIKDSYSLSGADFNARIGEKLANAESFVKQDLTRAETVLNAAGSNLKNLTAAGATRSALCYKKGSGFIAELNTLLKQMAVLTGQDFSLDDDKFFNHTLAAVSTSAKAKIFAPDGSTALSLAQIAHEGSQDVKIVPPNQIAAKVITGEADIAVLPANVAAKLISEGKPYKIVCAVTNGNLYGLVKK